MAYFNGLPAPKDKIAVLQGSIACASGLHELYFLKFEKIAMGIVWAPGLQAFKMMGSSDPPFGGLPLDFTFRTLMIRIEREDRKLS